MTKSEKIREYMRLAETDDFFYISGNICRGTKYVYRLASGAAPGAIERCPIALLKAGSPVWAVWASDIEVIRALEGNDVAMECEKVSVNSLFERGGTVSPWDVYVRNFGGMSIALSR